MRRSCENDVLCLIDEGGYCCEGTSIFKFLLLLPGEKRAKGVVFQEPFQSGITYNKKEEVINKISRMKYLHLRTSRSSSLLLH